MSQTPMEDMVDHQRKQIEILKQELVVANEARGALEHQRQQIELLKQELIDVRKDRDAQEVWVRRHEKHLSVVRAKVIRAWELFDTEKVEAYRALDWLRGEADRDDYDLD